jgi:hypothetical protein
MDGTGTIKKRAKMGGEKEPDSQGAFHIPPGYVTTTGFALKPGTSFGFSIFIHHPAHTTVHRLVNDNGCPRWSLAWLDMEPSGLRKAYHPSWDERPESKS